MKALLSGRKGEVRRLALQALLGENRFIGRGTLGQTWLAHVVQCLRFSKSRSEQSQNTGPLGIADCKRQQSDAPAPPQALDSLDPDV